MREPDLFDFTNELLNKYARRFDLMTDYQIAKELGCSQSTISNYRKHKTKMDPTTCVQIAEALKVDPILVIAKMKLENARTLREKNVWGKYAGRLFLAAIAAASLGTTDVKAERAYMGITDQTSYTLYAYICAIFKAMLRPLYRPAFALLTYLPAKTNPPESAHPFVALSPRASLAHYRFFQRLSGTFPL